MKKEKATITYSKFPRVATRCTHFCTEFFVGCDDIRLKAAPFGFAEFKVLLFDLRVSCTLRTKKIAYNFRVV